MTFTVSSLADTALMPAAGKMEYDETNRLKMSGRGCKWAFP